MPLITAIPMIIQRCNPDFPAEGIQTECSSVAEVVQIYRERLNLTLTPMTGAGECFWATIGDEQSARVSMDIHLERNGKDVCVKNDLTYKVLPDDRVRLTFRIC
jgi:hypothetical protein